MKDRKYLRVAKFEFLEMIKKPSFWLSTLFFPVFIGVIGFISGYSSQEAIEKIDDIGTGDFETILVTDESEIINTDLLTEPFEIQESFEEAQQTVKESSNTALIYIPENFLTENTYEIYYKETESLLTGSIFTIYWYGVN